MREESILFWIKINRIEMPSLTKRDMLRSIITDKAESTLTIILKNHFMILKQAFFSIKRWK